MELDLILFFVSYLIYLNVVIFINVEIKQWLTHSILQGHLWPPN